MANHGRSRSSLLVTLTTVALLLLAGCSGFFINPTLTTVTVTPQTFTITAGATQPLVATGTYNDGSTATLSSVTWTSADTSVATVSSGGLVTGVAPGTASITATLGIISGSASATVTIANLKSIAINPTSAAIHVGGTQPFTATGTLNDGSTIVLTTAVTWNSQTASVATIASTGVATGVAAGTTNITATSTSTSGTVTSNTAVLTVVSP